MSGRCGHPWPLRGPILHILRPRDWHIPVRHIRISPLHHKTRGAAHLFLATRFTDNSPVPVISPGFANVAKLVDALDLGSSGVTLGSSSLPIRTRSK